MNGKKITGYVLWLASFLLFFNYTFIIEEAATLMSTFSYVALLACWFIGAALVDSDPDGSAAH
jgi:hypothetical protein